MEPAVIVNHAFGKIFNMIYRIFWVRFLRNTTRLTHNKSVFFQKISKSVRKTPPLKVAPTVESPFSSPGSEHEICKGTASSIIAQITKVAKRQPALAAASQAKTFFQVFHFLPPYNFLKPPFRCNMISVLIVSVIVATFSATASKLILRLLIKEYYTNFTVSRKIK